MSAAWIVVADAYRARFFTADDASARLSEIETLSNPEVRLHERDLASDRGGCDRNSSGSSHGLDTRSNVKQETVKRFAELVCDHLEKGLRKNAFGKLYVVGAPAFLGLMRKHQSAALRRLISGEIAKDLTTQTPERIRDRLPARL